MEPDGIGLVLGSVIAALGGLAEPGPATVRINDAAPPDLWPLRFEVPGQQIDVHPSEINDIRLEETLYGEPGLTLRFGAEVTAWISGATRAHLGNEMPVSLCGAEWMAPRIQEPILTGNMRLTGSLTPEELLAAMHVMAGRVDCDGNAIPGAEDDADSRRRGDSRG